MRQLTFYLHEMTLSFGERCTKTTVETVEVHRDIGWNGRERHGEIMVSAETAYSTGVRYSNGEIGAGSGGRARIGARCRRQAGVSLEN
jgi:hypothetical protein